ncbi:hypothetical protein [Lysobacter sp. F60174L2]|uniref:hypothetical protein n=1 Tax=Lysobacter sp. F60174L2 TaxID=3459295 RepID=UPI00403DC450
MKHFPFQLAILGVAAAFAAPAQAIDDDRLVLRLGAMSVDAESELRGRTVVSGETIEFNEGFDFGGTETGPRIEGQFRFSERNRLLFNYFSYDKDRRWTLSDDVTYEDVTIPAGSFLETDVQFEVASLAYDFAVVETDTLSWGLQLGVEYARFEADARAELDIESYRANEVSDGYAPVVGTRVTFAPAENWRVIAQGQYLDADWGNFDDYEGDLARANALVEYRFSDNFGVHVGYDWFRLDVDRHGSDGMIGLRQEFKGPVAGITLAF